MHKLISVAVGWIAVVGLLVVSPPAGAQTDDDIVYPPLPTRAFAGNYFVTQQYRDMLGREPDEGGLAFWTDRLDRGMSPGGLIAQFVESPEFADVREPTARLYRAALGRLPDEGGWRYWSDRLAAGEGLESLAAAFINTPEGSARLGQDEPADLVQALYENVLGRTPDAAGEAFWSAELAGGRSRASVVVAFSESPEFVAAFEPEIRAALLYSGLLGRTPDGGGLDFWRGELAGGRSYVSTIDSFITGPEYEQRLRSLWCQTITLDEALDSHTGLSEFTERDRAVSEMSQQILAALATGFQLPDEFATTILDRKPAPVFVLGVHAPALDTACLPVLALASHPEWVQFAPTALTDSGMRAVREEIIDLAGPGGVRSVGRGGGLFIVELNAAGLPLADQILATYGDLITSFDVASFPYPMPSPLPEAQCASESAITVDAGELGLEVTIDIPGAVEPGGIAVGTFTVTNTGTETHTVFWGYEVTGFVGEGITASSRFNGFRKIPLRIAVLAPGDSTTGRLEIATDACDPADGYVLPPGDYLTWGAISVMEGAADGGLDPTAPSHLIRLPAQTLTLVD